MGERQRKNDITFHIDSMEELVDSIEEEIVIYHLANDTAMVDYLEGKRDGLKLAIQWAKKDLT